MPTVARAAPDSALEVYDAILAQGALPKWADRVRTMRSAFESRTGAFGPDDACFEARSRAFWDDAAAGQGFAEAVAPLLPESQRPWAHAFSRAHRGLFRARREAGALHLDDVWGGASFVLTEVEAGLRDALDSAPPLFDGRVAALLDPLRVVLLPGALFHPAEAMEATEVVLLAARGTPLRTGAVLDALLRMERQFASLSRMKASFAYRTEALSPRGSPPG